MCIYWLFFIVFSFLLILSFVLSSFIRKKKIYYIWHQQKIIIILKLTIQFYLNDELLVASFYKMCAMLCGKHNTYIFISYTENGFLLYTHTHCHCIVLYCVKMLWKGYWVASYYTMPVYLSMHSWYEPNENDKRKQQIIATTTALSVITAKQWEIMAIWLRKTIITK